ncbi:MAG: hypothetical protein IJ571_06130 [Ruminococcus sp.]|nr:hypothetical protein [Ruminococcus sp.]
MIAITGIHGNFYSNPFYYNIGNTLNGGGIDFIYAQTNDAFGQIETMNIRTNEPEIFGSWNERFEYTDDDIDNILELFIKAADRAVQAGYDGVQIHGAHGFFLSRLSAPRTIIGRIRQKRLLSTLRRLFVSVTPIFT